MDEINQIIASEREKSREKFSSAKTYTKALSFAYLLAFFAIGIWCGLSLVSAASPIGRLVFISAFVVWGVVTFTLLKLLPPNRVALSLTTSLSLLILGYLLFSIYKNYGG